MKLHGVDYGKSYFPFGEWSLELHVGLGRPDAPLVLLWLQPLRIAWVARFWTSPTFKTHFKPETSSFRGEQRTLVHVMRVFRSVLLVSDASKGSKIFKVSVF